MTRTSYHHGALPAALIEAGEALLAERGVEGFSLRETARRAGVSPGAPSHHFGDSKGLLTAIAAKGYVALNEALSAAAEAAGKDPEKRFRAQAHACTKFAIERPSRFTLMTRLGTLDTASPTFAEPFQASADIMDKSVAAVLAAKQITPIPIDKHAASQAFCVWTMIFGLCQQSIEGVIDVSKPGVLDLMLDCMAFLAKPA